MNDLAPQAQLAHKAEYDKRMAHSFYAIMAAMIAAAQKEPGG